MIKQAYINGFIRKCTEYQVDPRILVKFALLDPATMGDTRPVAPPQQLRDTATVSGTSQRLKYPNPLKLGILSRQPLSPIDMRNFGRLTSATPRQLEAAMKKVLDEKRKKEQSHKQPVFITR